MCSSDLTLALAIAAGQLTPGPLFASAAFFGQSLHGFQGAMLASMGIFLPAFIFSAAAIPLSQRLEFKTWWKDCLEVMSAVAILLMGRETIRLLPFFLERHAAYGLFAAALVASTRFQVNSSLLIVLGSLAGYLLF